MNEIDILKAELENARREAATVRRAYLHERGRANRTNQALEAHDPELAKKLAESAYKDPRKPFSCEVCQKKIWTGWFTPGTAGSPPSLLKCGACCNPPRPEDPAPITEENKVHHYEFDTDDVGFLEGEEGIALFGLFPMGVAYETVIMSKKTALQLAHALLGASLTGPSHEKP